MAEQIVTAENNPFFEKKEEPKSQGKKALNVLQGMVIVAFVMIILYLFIITPNQVDGLSMFPNFEDNELLLTNRIPQWISGTPLGSTLNANYQRGDVVVVDKPDFGHLIIKRIVGLPGEEISIIDGHFYINGFRLDEEYIDDAVSTRGNSFLLTGESKIIPAGHYFVAGDNRPNSLDSRAAPIGFVSKAELQGKVIFRFWPLTTLSFIGQGKTTLLNQ